MELYSFSRSLKFVLGRCLTLGLYQHRETLEAWSRVAVKLPDGEGPGGPGQQQLNMSPGGQEGEWHLACTSRTRAVTVLC